MFTLDTVIGLFRLAVASYNANGKDTEEYRVLYRTFRKGLDQLLPPIELADKNTWIYGPTRSGVQLNNDEIVAGQFQGKLYAVKLYKERTGLRLLACKQDVEHFFDYHGLGFNTY
jgi:hypothetical protein